MIEKLKEVNLQPLTFPLWPICQEINSAVKLWYWKTFLKLKKKTLKILTYSLFLNNQIFVKGQKILDFMKYNLKHDNKYNVIILMQEYVNIIIEQEQTLWRDQS